MAATTPRRSARVPHQHTPKMSDRKKGLFQSEATASRDSLTKHRQLTVLESESESDDCDLGIMGALDSSSCDENDPNAPKTPERKVWLGTRSQSKKLHLETIQDLKNFMKSPFTLNKYPNRYIPEKCTGSLSTPVTPHLQNHPRTPSSTHSCASAHTTSSTSSRARKSLANLIADTESCSSSLKDLNFDTDSGTDSKENTPSKSLRRSSRRSKMTPKFSSFRGILSELKKNASSLDPVVSLTKIDLNTMISPTQMLKTPHTTSETNSANSSPPKLGPNRRSMIQIDESPESTCSSEKSQKRLNYDSKNDHGPTSKHPRLDTNNAPKARTSLFNTDRLKEILSTKSFYGKSNPELNPTISNKLSNAIEATQSHRRRLFPQLHSQKRKRRPGQINMGVRHRIRKPKIHKNKLTTFRGNMVANAGNASVLNSTASSDTLVNSSMKSQDSSMRSQDTSQELLNGTDRNDPFDKEKQTIEALLSQWEEEEVPESERTIQQELPCFTKSIIEETNQIFQPVTAVQVLTQNIPNDTEAVILELGAQEMAVGAQNVQDVVMSEPGHRDSHGHVKGDFLPVDGGYILVADRVPEQEVLPDLDEIERELKMLDEQILQMAATNNIDPSAVLVSTEPAALQTVLPTAQTSAAGDADKTKLFPIFSNPNPGVTTPTTKGVSNKKKTILKSGKDQYVIDAGQTNFGATQCGQCGVIYQIGDPQDEHDHLVHHNATDVLKFNGLKEECVVGRSASARCVRVRGGHAGWRRVRALLERVVHPHLGYDAALPNEQLELYTAYLYIDKRTIVGCLVVEPRLRAHRLLPGDPDCCSVEEYPVKCGVSRIWTHRSWRRRGLATRMLECARASFLLGAALARQDLAFSAPTAAGKALATHYCGTPNFYVYLD
ncbi:hypothetical protein O0L34_g3438 [Tuta absoluta]|nr:hypothetical protein O0L34_g3438 [Tuta absoluta]